MSKKCKCRERTQRRCQNVSPLSLAVAGQTIFDRRGPLRLNFFPRSSTNYLNPTQLLSVGITSGNAVSLAANSQTVV